MNHPPNSKDVRATLNEREKLKDLVGDMCDYAEGLQGERAVDGTDVAEAVWDFASVIERAIEQFGAANQHAERFAELVRATPDEEAAKCLHQLQYLRNDLDTIQANVDWAMKVIARLLVGGERLREALEEVEEDATGIIADAIDHNDHSIPHAQGMKHAVLEIRRRLHKPDSTP